jgi:hypothetical protein
MPENSLEASTAILLMSEHKNFWQNTLLDIRQLSNENQRCNISLRAPIFLAWEPARSCTIQLLHPLYENKCLLFFFFWWYWSLNSGLHAC